MDQFSGTLIGRDSTRQQAIRLRLDADTGNITAGGADRGGDLALQDSTGALKIWLDAGGTERTPADPLADKLYESTCSVLISGTGSVQVGGAGRAGSLTLRSPQNQAVC